MHALWAPLKISWFKHLKHGTPSAGSWSNSNGKIKRKTHLLLLWGKHSVQWKEYRFLSFYLHPSSSAYLLKFFLPTEMIIQPVIIVSSMARVLWPLTGALHVTRVSFKYILCLGAPCRFLWIKKVSVSRRDRDISPSNTPCQEKSSIF